MLTEGYKAPFPFDQHHNQVLAGTPTQEQQEQQQQQLGAHTSLEMSAAEQVPVSRVELAKQQWRELVNAQIKVKEHDLDACSQIQPAVDSGHTHTHTRTHTHAHTHARTHARTHAQD